MLKVIIFDFDGTIADTFDAIVNISNRLSTEFGYKQTTPEELDEIRNLSSKEIIRRSGVSIFKLPFILRKFKLELNREIHKLKTISGIKDSLIQLKHQGNRLAIITSNDRENVIKFLQNNNLQELFDTIYSGATLFGKSKVINKFIREQNIEAAEAIYVGDETRDIEAAKKSKMKTIAVSWGFNSEAVLAAHQPDFLIHHPSELVTVVEQLQQTSSKFI
jgi:phosphoglycolate phosphatase